MVKGGVVVDVSGVQGFIPQGQLCARETICNPGDKIEVKILSLDKSQNNLILSNKRSSKLIWLKLAKMFLHRLK